MLCLHLLPARQGLDDQLSSPQTIVHMIHGEDLSLRTYVHHRVAANLAFANIFSYSSIVGRGVSLYVSGNLRLFCEHWENM
mmetsp:Transcript_32165/g.72254  ORF Transcript_32165/g.72254 Transcript_32165/m.72254 type:complete len:81 (-) Transcript_32165:1601-1843(-)